MPNAAEKAARELMNEIVERYPHLKAARERQERYLLDLYGERARIDRKIQRARALAAKEAK